MPLKVPRNVLRRTTLPAPTSSVNTTPLFSELLPFVSSQGQPKMDVSVKVPSSTRLRSPPLIHTPAAPISCAYTPRTAQSEE